MHVEATMSFKLLGDAKFLTAESGNLRAVELSVLRSSRRVLTIAKVDLLLDGFSEFSRRVEISVLDHHMRNYFVSSG